jgi:hypothetical protein
MITVMMGVWGIVDGIDKRKKKARKLDRNNDDFSSNR